MSIPRISTKGESIPFQLDVICSHIILSKRNEKKSERFPEEQLDSAPRGLGSSGLAWGPGAPQSRPGSQGLGRGHRGSQAMPGARTAFTLKVVQLPRGD